MLGNLYNSSQICIGDDGGRSWQMGLQFPVTLPVPVTIAEARLVLTSSGDNSGSFTTRLRAVAQDDMVAFVAGPAPAFTAAYPLTAAFVDWSLPDLAADATLRSPDLREVVQEVVDRPGWTSGGHVGLILTESPTSPDWRCVSDRFAVNDREASLELDWLERGTPVCVDARGFTVDLEVVEEPPAGCPASGPGPQRDFVFGAVDDLALVAGSVDLGPARCAGGALGTTGEIVRSDDPDPMPGGGRFYLWRLKVTPTSEPGC